MSSRLPFYSTRIPSNTINTALQLLLAVFRLLSAEVLGLRRGSDEDICLKNLAPDKRTIKHHNKPPR